MVCHVQILGMQMLLYTLDYHHLRHILMLLVIHIIRYGSHDKVCKLHKQTLVRTDILHITEHSIFSIQNLFQLAHFLGTERVLDVKVYIIAIKRVNLVIEQQIIHLVEEVVV